MSDGVQYALTHDGQVLKNYLGETIAHAIPGDPPFGVPEYLPPDSVWLPVVNHDTQPLVRGQHYRMPPTYEVHGDVVRRVFEVRAIRSAA